MKNYLIEHADENLRLDFQNKIDVYNLDKELAYFQWDKNELILDAGCGTGNVINNLLALGMTRIHGIDFSEDRIKYASERFNKYEEVKLFNNSLDNTQLENNSYDKILCRYIYEHIPNPIAVIQELHRVLRPQGLIYIINFDDIFFNFYTKNEEFNEQLKTLKAKVPQDFGIAKKLPQILKKCGFTNIEWEAEAFFFKGKRLEMEMENNRMRLEQGKGHLSTYFASEAEYLSFAKTYIEEMKDDCNVLSTTKYLIKAAKKG